ncbi:unnamed protein product [Prorocentrum cordatum]|uniref:Uncharacterized protein n=1 Tax=Prorocentrum cordatum TaxID=2364126 RepID=A0ABN9Q4K5_9DINO|nr:unnamed protein product [Polarella glacialis]CAK0901889.1 unnamed protein product [Polarella glacialis]
MHDASSQPVSETQLDGFQDSQAAASLALPSDSFRHEDMLGLDATGAPTKEEVVKYDPQARSDWLGKRGKAGCFGKQQIVDLEATGDGKTWQSPRTADGRPVVRPSRARQAPTPTSELPARPPAVEAPPTMEEDTATMPPAAALVFAEMTSGKVKLPVHAKTRYSIRYTVEFEADV